MTNKDKEIFKGLAHKNPYYDFYIVVKDIVNSTVFDYSFESQQKRIKLLRETVRIYDAEKPIARKILKNYGMPHTDLKRKKWEKRNSELK